MSTFWTALSELRDQGVLDYVAVLIFVAVVATAVRSLSTLNAIILAGAYAWAASLLLGGLAAYLRLVIIVWRVERSLSTVTRERVDL